VIEKGSLTPVIKSKEVIDGVNGIEVKGVSYQVVQKLAQGGMGVVYRATRHSKEGPGGQPLKESEFPPNVIIKEMTFAIPELLIASKDTAEAYVKDWRENTIAKEGLVSLATQKRSIFPTTETRREQIQQKQATDARRKILAKVTDSIKKEMLEKSIPKHPSTMNQVAIGLDGYYAGRLRKDIFASITYDDYRKALSKFIPENIKSVQGVAQGLASFATSKDAEVVSIRNDLQAKQIQFLQEATTLRLLEMRGVRNIPRIIGGNVLRLRDKNGGRKDIKRLFMIQTELPGRRIDEILASLPKNGHFSEAYATKKAIQLTQILEAIQAAGIAHRDIKPENVLLDETKDEINIVDFGIASPLDDKTKQLLESHEAFVQADAEGSDGYFAPETNQKKVAPQVDTFSVARMLYCMMTGQAVLINNPYAFEEQQLSKTSEISPELKNIIRGGCAPSVANRYTLKEFREQLERHLTQIAMTARRSR